MTSEKVLIHRETRSWSLKVILALSVGIVSSWTSSAAIAAPAPVAHWTFDRCDGDVVPDGVGTGGSTDAHLSGGMACAPGALGTAGIFDGVDDKAEVADHARLHFTNQLTISAWVRPDVVSGERTIVNKWFAPDSYGLFLQEGSYVFRVVFPDGGWGQWVTVSAPATAGVFTHVAGVFDGPTRTARIYLNGVLQASAATPRARLQQSDRPVVIGNNPDWNAFAGAIDDVRLYDKSLNDKQVEALATRLSIRAWIDGRSRLVVGPTGLYWHHLDFAAPGREVGANEPTYVNGNPWQPVWPDVPDAENRGCNCTSSILAPIPAVTSKPVDVRVVAARSRVRLIQRPTNGNGEVLIVEFDDNEPGSSDWYEILVTPRSEQPTGPAARWSFDVCTGGVVPDTTRAERGVTDAVLGNGAQCVEGAVGNAGAFDGVDDQAEVPDHDRLHFTDRITVAAWVKPDDVAGSRTILNKWFAPDSYGLFVHEGTFGFSVVYPDGGWGESETVSALAAAGEWSHVAGVFDGVRGTLELYVNGVLRAAAPASRSLLQQSHRPVVMGRVPDWNAYAGLIDEVNLFDAALDGPAIRNLAIR